MSSVAMGVSSPQLSQSLCPLTPQEDAGDDDEDSDQFIEVSVVEPVKIGDGMSSYMAFKVITKTNVSYFK